MNRSNRIGTNSGKGYTRRCEQGSESLPIEILKRLMPLWTLNSPLGDLEDKDSLLLRGGEAKPPVEASDRPLKFQRTRNRNESHR